MLRSSPSLASKLGLNKLHKPLPLSSRDARKLLGLLKTSFRQHLDAEHGPLPAPTPVREVKSATLSSHPSPPIEKDTQHHYAERHFEALLSNPLFSKSPHSRAVLSNSHHEFDSKVAAGLMDLNLAYEYLNTVVAEATRSSVINHQGAGANQDSIKQYGAGLRVLKWLRSSGFSTDLSFLEHVNFTRILMRVLVAEGLQDVAWAWVTTCFDRYSHTPHPAKPVFRRGRAAILGGPQKLVSMRDVRFPFAALIQAECRDGTNIERACLLLGKASTYLEASGFDKTDRDWLISSGQLSIIRYHLKMHSTKSLASAQAFEILLDTLPGSLAPREGIEYLMAHLLLTHPTMPRAEPALEVLLQWQPAAAQSLSETAPLMPQEERQRRLDATVIQLGLDLTHFLLENDRVPEADWVIAFLRSKFPSELGEKNKKKLDEATAEASSLDLLWALNLKIA